MATVENPFDKVRRKMVAARIEFMGQLARFNNNELTQPPTDGEWSPLLIAFHLYIADAVALEQMRLVQDEDNPLIEEIEDETPSRTREAEQPTSLDSVMAGMAARREELFQYLSELPVDAWERPYRHPTAGQLKFYQLVNILPQHDRIHAQQLAEMKADAEAAREV